MNHSKFIKYIHKSYKDLISNNTSDISNIYKKKLMYYLNGGVQSVIYPLIQFNTNLQSQFNDTKSKVDSLLMPDYLVKKYQTYIENIQAHITLIQTNLSLVDQDKKIQNAQKETIKANFEDKIAKFTELIDLLTKGKEKLEEKIKIDTERQRIDDALNKKREELQAKYAEETKNKLEAELEAERKKQTQTPTPTERKD
jgi:hypothetical protein